jgi:outer membrane receptor protein involved in Fe transport
VNFVLKRNFEGLLLEGQAGITQKGDWPRYQISATAGANLADGRGNIMVHLGYSDDRGLLSRERKNTRIDDFDSMYLLGGPTYDPSLFGVSFSPYMSGFPPQGRFTAGGVSFTYGNTGQLQSCFTTNGPTCTGGPIPGGGTGPNGFNRQFYRTLSTPVKRLLFAEQGHYDITDNITFITEATYAKTTAKSEIEPFPMDSGGASGVFSAVGGVWDIQNTAGGACNPLVPAIICTTATDTNGNGLKDIAFRKRLTDFGTRNLTADRDFFRAVVGFEGNLFNDRWHWDLTYNFGRTQEDQVANGQVNADHLRQALNVFTETTATGDINKNGVIGDIVCADPIARSQGCVPLNLFGTGSISPAAVQFVAAETNHTFKQTQQVVNANLSGTVVDLPAGPLGLAVGGEYRRESSQENWDALTNVGGNLGNALPDVGGKFDVKEAYAEVNVPILKDLPFAKQLNLRAAGRVSDYSTIGHATTWNIGGDWAPIDDVRFRSTYAKSVRAPNIGELFSGAAQTFPTGIADPCIGVTATSTGTTAEQCRLDAGVRLNIAQNGKFTLTQADRQGVSGFNIGNPNLGPETSHSFTAGVVVNPRSVQALRNLVLSVDYWHIKIDDAIIAPGRNTILDQCYNQGNNEFCQFVTRYQQQLGASSPGALQFVNSVGINASTFNAAGIDSVLSYRTALGWLPGLTANARISWTHYLKGYVVPLPGTDKDPFAGEIETARDKVNGTIAFNTQKWGLSFTGNYIGKSYEDNVWLAGRNLGPHDVSVPGKFYLDTQASFTPTKNYEFFVGVDNLLDTKAPNILSGVPFNVTGADTDAGVYDIFGRRFYAGARLRF